ncbi:mitochondrial uncoupling protein 4-like isoform X2 [Mya arenaria]|uniref:mitochondrial uncoupling protein 4-like isoform X2 n=1 Tax=Mya arenaria TaxID=6604 RepID=UPI0022E1D446|nr:mitochondrial uncoupling protein 4-like isoform X2 [Mya arenaria]
MKKAEPRREDESIVYKYALSSVSAVVSETVTYPLDLTKTRLMIQGEITMSGSTVSYSNRGMFKILHVTEEGFFKLWQGVSPALYRHIVYTGCRMNMYEVLRDRVFIKNDDGTFALWKGVIVGSMSGAFGQLVASPTDLIKVNMQMEGRRRLEGKPARIKSCSHAFRMILAESGVRGLWRGWIPNVQRAALVNMGDLVTYDTVKRQLLIKTDLPDNYIVHALSSACSGMVAAIMCTPADVVKTRVMNQPLVNGKPAVYKGSIDCLLKTLNQEGFLALYKGFFPTYCRMAPWSLTFWIVYEELRKVTGHSSF